jgi:hypothetical protein
MTPLVDLHRHLEGSVRPATCIELATRTGASRRGVGTKLVAIASDGARTAGCEWLHVDFEDHLRPFYFDSCGFSPANAGLIALRG